MERTPCVRCHRAVQRVQTKGKLVGSFTVLTYISGSHQTSRDKRLRSPINETHPLHEMSCPTVKSRHAMTEAVILLHGAWIRKMNLACISSSMIYTKRPFSTHGIRWKVTGRANFKCSWPYQDRPGHVSRKSAPHYPNEGQRSVQILEPHLQIGARNPVFPGRC